MKKAEAYKTADLLNNFVFTGCYILSNGEQARPVFKIYRRGRLGYQIDIEYCFAPGTLYALESHFLSDDELDYYMDIAKRHRQEIAENIENIEKIKHINEL